MKQKLTALSLFCFSILYVAGAWGLKLGSLRKPGPGFLPRLVGVCLVLCTGAHLWNVVRKKTESSSDESSEGNAWTVAWLAGAILAYPVLLYFLKFILATFVVIYFMLLVLKFKGPVWDCAIALGVVVLTFVIFSMVLGVTLSIGPIEEFFFRLRG